MMTNGDCQGRIFLSYPHTNYGFFLCSTINTAFLCLRNMKMAFRVPGCVDIQHTCDMVTSKIDRHVASVWFIFPMGWYGYVR